MPERVREFEADRRVEEPTSIRRVLVVDDSRLERRILAVALNRWGFEVLEAENAHAALDICRARPPDLILSDWMMPGMTGPEFCRVLRETSQDSYAYFILLTSKTDASEVAHGLNQGADDFLSKPVNPDELRARITAGDRIIRMQRELALKNRMISDTLSELQTVYDRIDDDLAQARKIQEALVPRPDQSFGRSHVSLLVEPCGHIGGDLPGAFSPGRNRVAFYSIDVSGHGITSALMTARLGSYLSCDHPDQNLALEKRFERFYSLKQPADVAAQLNARLNADAGIDQYFTMAYAIADLRSGLVRLVQAGHPNPLLIRASGGIEVIGNGGHPIGLLPDVDFQQVEVQMDPGDRMLFYSDGLTECRLEGGNMLGDDGLIALIQDAADLPARQFLDELYAQITGRLAPEIGMDDDISATLFDYFGPEPD